MQTTFTPAQLAQPRIAEANTILRKCVHCGFCTATCPTYVLLGDELDSPRGRIYLIKDMLEKGRPADAKTVKHIDRCLSCLSCMTTCPSGVHYMHLVDHARAHIEKTYRRPFMDRTLRAVLEFGTGWCGHCRAAQPALAEALAPYALLRHIKVEDGPGHALGRSLGVKHWPTLVLLHNGQEIARVVRPTQAADLSAVLSSPAH